MQRDMWDTQRHRGEEDVKVEAETGVMHLQAKEPQGYWAASRS